MSSLFKLKNYIYHKEEDKWTKDQRGDGKPDFYHIFYPLFWCIGLYFFKISCIKTDHVYLKVIMCISVIFLALVCESHFDRNLHNDAPLWLLSIPLSIFLVCQALLDWFFLKNNQDDLQKRLFYSLDNPLKKIWVYGNILATVVFCSCLFNWLYIL